ncbi:hypothetical protein Ddye_032725 [Dipteronia dyeriana]|uniref:Uncharacterized protein n=1 Tax=Dipteronia dyeriana TaxID=168575 RepID=A0AAD9TDD7_9ROSI|nr:hypothetical protein Ddye_032725 [Dipteronia dyeriana]
MHFVQCARMRSALVRKQSSCHVLIGIMGIALYHGWELEIHVPVCRFELPTDDAGYERRRNRRNSHTL